MLMIIDTSSFNVALASIGADFDVPVDQTGAVNLGYVVALAAMIPLSGWMGERFGTVRILMFSLGVMVAGAIIGATAASLPIVVAGRIAQGIGGGGLVPLAYALMFRNFAPSTRLRIMAALALPISLAPALGPLIGGVMVDQLGWRWVFLLSVPFAATGIVVALTFAQETESRAVRRLDVVGAVLTVIGFGASVLGVQRLATGDDPFAGGIALGVGLCALLALIPRELRLRDAAFLDIGLFRHRVFAKATILTSAHSVGFMGFGLASPLLLQTQLGASALQAGLMSVAGALGPIVSSRFARQLITAIGARRTVALSQIGIITGLSVTFAGYVAPSVWVIMAGMFVCGASSLLTIMSCQTAGFAAVPETNLGDATTLDGTSRQLSNALGIAVVSATLALSATLDASVVVTVALTLGGLVAFHLITLAVVAAPGQLPLPSSAQRSAR